jgi:hypothetical protein
MSKFPKFDTIQQTKDYYSDKYEIKEIIDEIDTEFGRIMLVIANPVKLMGAQGVLVSVGVNSESVHVMFPCTKANQSFLFEIARNSLLPINFDNFDKKNFTIKYGYSINKKDTLVYVHKSIRPIPPFDLWLAEEITGHL